MVGKGLLLGLDGEFILDEEDWRESLVSVILGDLGQEQLHWLVLSETSAYSLILQ